MSNNTGNAGSNPDFDRLKAVIGRNDENSTTPPGGDRARMDVSAEKIRMDLTDLEGRKQSLILALQNDIEAINDQLYLVFYQIGLKAYEMYRGGSSSLEQLKESFDNITPHMTERIAKEKKIAEIAERYDEEIALLEKLLPIGFEDMQSEVEAEAEAYAAAEAEESEGVCPNCNAPYVPGDDVFCKNCGRKL